MALCHSPVRDGRRDGTEDAGRHDRATPMPLGRRSQLGAGLSDFRHGRGEEVPVFGNRLDVWATVRLLAKDLPEEKHLLDDVPLFNEGVRPQRLHQLGLVDQPAATKDHQRQGVECLRREIDALAAPRQPPRAKVEAKRPEFEQR